MAFVREGVQQDRGSLWETRKQSPWCLMPQASGRGVALSRDAREQPSHFPVNGRDAVQIQFPARALARRGHRRASRRHGQHAGQVTRAACWTRGGHRSELGKPSDVTRQSPGKNCKRPGIVLEKQRPLEGAANRRQTTSCSSSSRDSNRVDDRNGRGGSGSPRSSGPAVRPAQSTPQPGPSADGPACARQRQAAPGAAVQPE